MEKLIQWKTLKTKKLMQFQRIKKIWYLKGMP
jgi:hypothetical protein